MKKMIATLVVLAASSGAFACPMCKDSVANKEGDKELHDSMSATGQNISGGINTSVFFMLGGFVGTVGLISTVLVRGARGGAKGRGFPIDRDDKKS
jgi:hypothetical protein